jgi:hypothetical protein
MSLAPELRRHRGAEVGNQLFERCQDHQRAADRQRRGDPGVGDVRHALEGAASADPGQDRACVDTVAEDGEDGEIVQAVEPPAQKRRQGIRNETQRSQATAPPGDVGRQECCPCEETGGEIDCCVDRHPHQPRHATGEHHDHHRCDEYAGNDHLGAHDDIAKTAQTSAPSLPNAAFIHPIKYPGPLNQRGPEYVN